MTAEPGSQDARAAEAARWFARLNATSVTTAQLDAFRAWRSVPANAEAYARVSRIWRSSADLKADPDVRRALNQVRARSKRRGGVRMGVGGAGLGLAALGLGVVLIAEPLLHRPQVFQTAVGEQRRLVLEDGSRVSLDTDTRISVRYSKRLRAVTLEQGQALFDVVHRPDRPFQVRAASTNVDDLGTVFDVRRDHDQVRVTLVSGALQIRTDGPRRLTLSPGQQALSEAGGARLVTADAAKATSWVTGRLMFDNIPLWEAVEEINRYGRRKVVLDAGALGDIRISGAFETGDTDAFVSAVTKLYDLTARETGSTSVTLSAPTQRAPT